MSVLLETSLGDIIIDLYFDQCPKTVFNFLRLCLLKKLNDRLISSVQKDYLCRVTGDDHSVFKEKYFDDEITKRKFNRRGIVAMANEGQNLNAANFFITLTDQPLDHNLYKKHTIFGQVVEDDSFRVLDKINQVFVNQNDNFRPFQNIRIKHTLVIEDPFEGKEALYDFKLPYPSRSPSPLRT